MKRIWLSLIVSGALAFGADRALITDDYSNYFSTAKEIPLNMEIAGSIETVGDIDIFKFTLSEDDGLYFYGKSEDGFLSLYVIEKESIETLSEYLSESTWDIRTDIKYSIKNSFQFDFSFASEAKKGFNFNKGEYYLIVIGRYDDSTTPYTFRIESELNEGSVELDKVTLEYCKTHLSECGIEVDSSLKYTQSDLDSAKETAKEEVRNELSFTKTKVDSLSSGWNLAGTGETVETSELNGEIWTFKNGEWSHNPSKIEAFGGFWIKK